MRRWVIGGVAVLVVVVAALVVPVRDGGTLTESVTEVATEEGSCGKITAAGDLELRRTVPLIDLGVVARVEATLAHLGFDIEATDTCDDIDALNGGAVLAHPDCDHVIMWSQAATEEMEGVREAGGSAAMSLCNDAAVGLMVFGSQDGQLSSSASWSEERYELGAEFVVNQPYWCLDTSYWLESHAGTHTDMRSLEPVVLTWCIDLVYS